MAEPSVLHLSFSDARGGAARSAHKIHDGLRRLGLTSRMLVRYKDTGDPDVGLLATGWRRWLDAVGAYGLDPLGAQALGFPSSFLLARHPWFAQADVVQLYTVHGGFMSLLALPRLGRGKRLVWRFSDMWPATGRCAYPRDCTGWRTGCGRCPRPGEPPTSLFDLSGALWRVKKRVFDRLDLRLVVTNSWMRAQVAQSPLFSRFPVAVIPNGVDADLLRPVGRREAREALGLPPQARVVLFAAHVAVPGTRKGGEHVVPVMERLAAEGRDDLVLAVLGERAESWPPGQGYRTARLGSVRGDRFLAAAYGAADILLFPALAENFPNTILEAMACGTPVAAFDSGGVSDILRPGETGWLAPTGDADALAHGAARLLDDAPGREAMSRRCREVVLAGYTLRHQAEAFARLYAGA